MNFLQQNCRFGFYTQSKVSLYNTFKCGEKDLDDFFTKDAFLQSEELLCKNYCFFPYWNIWELVARLAINRGLLLLIIVEFMKYELHFPMWVIATMIALIFSMIKNPIKDVVICTLCFVAIFLWIYFLWKLLVKVKYKKNWEGLVLRQY